jgi:hypothetical protein
LKTPTSSSWKPETRNPIREKTGLEALPPPRQSFGKPNSLQQEKMGRKIEKKSKTVPSSRIPKINLDKFM